MRITFTYDTRTEESTLLGDVEDHGFYEPSGGWRWSLFTPAVREELESTPEIYNYDWGLESAIEDAKRLGCSEPSSDPVSLSMGQVSFCSTDPDQDPGTGEETYYYVHFNGVGKRTMRRLCKAFGCKYFD